jgi:dolichol-phosphate mannosyltransferase
VLHQKGGVIRQTVPRDPLKMNMTERISVILPTYNEKGNILSLIDAIHNELGNYDHEILVVDDNSPDGTYKAVVDCNYPYVRAILRTENPGFANSIRCGLENARGDIFVIMDSDFNHQPKYLTFMIQAISYYDCVSASRFLYGGKMDSRTRHILSWVFNIFVRLMTGGCITDSLYGFLAIKREIIERCNYDDIFWGYGDYCIRLIYYLQRDNVDILQIPAVNGRRKEGEGNNRFFKVFWQYFIAVIKLTYKVRVKDHHVHRD